MPKKVLSEEQAREVLDSGLYGFLGLCKDEQPYIVPLNYVVMGNKIYLHSGPTGQKLEYLTVNPKVCFSVCDLTKPVYKEKACEFGMRYRSVIVLGIARILTESEEKRFALQALVDKYDREARTKRLESKDVAGISVLEIEIMQISGKENTDTAA